MSLVGKINVRGASVGGNSRDEMYLVVQKEEIKEIKREIEVIDGNIERLRALKETLVKALESFPPNAF